MKTKEENESKWISVKDRLPEEGQIVDIWKIDSYRGDFYRLCNHKYSNNHIIEFTHWMPLPKPPKQ